MKQEVRHRPSIRQLIHGTRAFDKTVNLTTFTRMVRALAVTAIRPISHIHHNKDQIDILSELQDPWTIALLVPGFQLDGKSMLGMKRALNARGIPALFPEDLPYGLDAIFFREHPHKLVDCIVRYAKTIQEKYPRCHLLIIWHSYGGAEAIHAAHQLTINKTSQKSKVIPASISWTLSPVGAPADAIHSLIWRTPSDIFSGRDPFIPNSQRFLWTSVEGIKFINPYDWYLSADIQAGDEEDYENNPNNIVSKRESNPGHYHVWSDPDFSEYIITEVLKRAENILHSTPQ